MNVEVKHSLFGFVEGQKFIWCSNNESGRFLKYYGNDRWGMVDSAGAACNGLKGYYSRECYLIDGVLHIGAKCFAGYRPVSDNPKIFYKVVTKNLLSNNNFRVQYILNQYVYGPKETYLFVFDDLGNAQQYKGRDSRCEIYECQCDDIYAEGLIPSHLSGLYPDMSSFPHGTRFARGVKLIKKIEEEYKPKVGRKWYFISNRNGETITEVWVEQSNGKLKGEHSGSEAFQVTDGDKLSCAYQLGKLIDGWYVTHDKNELDMIVNLLNKKVIKFVN